MDSDSPPGAEAQAGGTFLQLWMLPQIRRRAIRMAVLVGTLLIIINYADRLLLGGATPLDWIKMGLTYLVPYAVSSYSSVQARRERG